MKYVCKICSKQFNDTPSSKRKFCSRKCKEKWQSSKPELSSRWKGGEKQYECLLCKKKFRRKPSNIKTHQNIFCSCKCQAIWKCKHQKTKNTDIEVKMAEILRDNKIEFMEQVVYPNICIADFYLPKYNLAIFCDGEYWHNYPNGKARDKKQIEQLNRIGVKAIRLWGKEIIETEFATQPAWGHHLQIMVLSEEPLLYLKKFL